MTGSILIEKATALAVRVHADQKRKESDRPYIVHPVAVALILARHGFSETVIAAAVVHDVVEDTPITASELRAELGDAVAELVASITHDDALSWEDKKKAYIEAVRVGSEDVKAIAVADKIANAQSLLAGYEAQGVRMWEHFNSGRDKKLWFENAMLAMLQETWQHPLVEEYAALVAQMNALA